MPETNNQRLAELMQSWRLDVDNIARLTRRSRFTVTAWLKPPASKSHRSMPDHAIEMIEMKLSIKKHTGQEPD